MSLEAKLVAETINTKTCFNNPSGNKKQALQQQLLPSKPASSPISSKAQESAAKLMYNSASKNATGGGLVYDATVDKLQGAIRFVDTPYGAVERKGAVEFFSNLIVHQLTAIPADSLPDDVRLVNDNQMWIRFLDEGEPKYSV